MDEFIFPYKMNATDRCAIVADHNGLKVSAYVNAGDNPCPWRQEPHNHGEVSEWTNRAVRGDEIVLHSVQAFTDSGAGRGKLLYDLERAMEKFGRFRNDSSAHWLGTVRERVDVDVERLRKWCRGEWYYVDIRVVVYADDDQPTTLGSQGMGPVHSDDLDTINACVQRCVNDALAEAYQRVWEKFRGRDDDEVQTAI